MASKYKKMSELLEEVTEDGVKIYGSASYETQVAILSHYLHALDGKHDIASGEKRYEILNAIHDYIEYKKSKEKSKEWLDVDEEDVVTMVAEESPLQYDLFSDFFNVPFPAPENPKFTFIDLFAGMGGFRLAMQAQGGKCVFSSEWNTYSQKTYFSNFGEMPFGDIANKYNSYDLIGEHGDEIVKKIKKMCIRVAVGNPPYQDEGGSGGTNDAPIFQEFSRAAKTLSTPFSTLIIPSKWFTGGRSNLLDPFRKEMLTSGTVSKLTAFHDASDLFPKDVEIKGGVCFYLDDSEHEGECDYSLVKNGGSESAQLNLKDLDVIIREPRLAKIVEKVMSKASEENLGVVESFMSADTPFGIPTNPRSSKKTPFLISDVESDEFNLKLHYWIKGVRKIAYVRRSDVRKNSRDIDAVKVYVPAAGGSGTDQLILGQPILEPSPSVCSQTYLYMKFNSENEAKNFISYLKTRFFRLLVSSMKITQHAQTSVYHFVPMQDFTHPWTDRDLFKK